MFFQLLKKPNFVSLIVFPKVHAAGKFVIATCEAGDLRLKFRVGKIGRSCVNGLPSLPYFSESVALRSGMT